MSIVLSGCVSQTEYDKVAIENEELKQRVLDLESENNALLSENEARQLEQLQLEQLQETKYTEADALKLLKDYYEFYNAEMVYRRPKVRKVSDNEFIISLEECMNKPEFKKDDFFWESNVKQLTIYANGKYDVKTTSGKY